MNRATTGRTTGFRVTRLVLAFALVVGSSCTSSSETSESLDVTVGSSNPAHQNDPQLIQVTVAHATTVNYTDVRSGPNPYGADSSSEYLEPVVPERLSLTLDGVPVPCALPLCNFYWDTSAYPDGEHVFVATASYRSLSGTGRYSWKLDRRPATFQPLEVPGLADAPGEHEVVVSFGPGNVPLVLSTHIRDPASGSSDLSFLQRDGGSWEVTPLGGDLATHPALIVDASGIPWAAWDEGTGTRVRRRDGGQWEELDGGLLVRAHSPSLVAAGPAVFLATVEPTAPLLRFEQGQWQPAAPVIGLVPDEVNEVRAAVTPAGMAYLAVERVVGGYRIEVLQSSGAQAWQQMGGELPFAASDGGTSLAVRLIGLELDRAGQPVVATTNDGEVIEVYGWSGTQWRRLGHPISFHDEAAGTSYDDPRLAAMASVPDGGLALLYVSENGTFRLDAWDGTEWLPAAGPLRAVAGTAYVDRPALAYDSAGRPLAAWHEWTYGEGPRLIVWRP